MKRILMLALAILSVLSAWAYDFSAKNEDGVEIYYNVLSSKECEVTVSPSRNYSGAVRIPAAATYSGKELSVTSIGDCAFYLCTSLTSVEIPNSVTSIGNGAFYNCSSLTSAEIPNSVTSIGKSAFYWCFSLTSIEIPNSVTSIGEDAFYDCSSLTSVVIPSSVTSIGDFAFDRCSSLTKAEFASIEHLCSIDFEGVFSNPLSYAHHLYINGEEVTDVVIPNSVTSIGGAAFSDCTSLISVVIPNSVTSIGYGAFYDCSSLTSVEIPNSVTSIGNYAFYKCISLTSIEIPNSVTSIGNYAFSDCTSLTSVVIPNSVTSIGNGAFYKCISLTSVEIPNSVTSIGNYAFYKCTSLSSVEIPNSVTSIGDFAFYKCSSLIEVKVLAENPPTVYSTTFDYNNSGTLISKTLYIPTGTKAKYEAAEVWKDFWEIVEFDTNAILAPSLQPAIVSMCGGEVTVEDADGLTSVAFFAPDGACLGVVPVVDGRAQIATERSMVIVRLGDRAVKVAR